MGRILFDVIVAGGDGFGIGVGGIQQQPTRRVILHGQCVQPFGKGLTGQQGVLQASGKQELMRAVASRGHEDKAGAQ